MTDKDKKTIKKLAALDNILDQLVNGEFDHFRVSLMNGEEEVFDFALIEDSFKTSKQGLINQLRKRADEVLEELRNDW